MGGLGIYLRHWGAFSIRRLSRQPPTALNPRPATMGLLFFLRAFWGSVANFVAIATALAAPRGNMTLLATDATSLGTFFGNMSTQVTVVTAKVGHFLRDKKMGGGVSFHKVQCGISAMRKLKMCNVH